MKNYLPEKHLFWGIILIISLTIISFTILSIVNHPYEVKLSMDNNTLEAIKSVNWTNLNQKECMPVEAYYPNWNYPNKFNYTITNYSNNWVYVSNSEVKE